MRFGLLALLFSLSALGRELSDDQWSLNMLRAPDLSIPSLLSSGVIIQTEVPNVYVLNILGNMGWLKERRAVNAFSQALIKPIVLVSRTPGFHNTPVVDAIVYSRDRTTPEYNVSLKSIVRPEDLAHLNSTIFELDEKIESLYNSKKFARIYWKYWLGPTTLHLDAVKRLLGITNKGVRPIAVGFDYLRCDNGTPVIKIIETENKRSKRMRFCSGEISQDSSIDLDHLERLMNGLHWRQTFFIFNNDLVEVTSRGSRRYKVNQVPLCQDELEDFWEASEFL